MISQALPVFLDELVPDWGAILLSVTLILLFGEVSSRILQIKRLSMCKKGFLKIFFLLKYKDPIK